MKNKVQRCEFYKLERKKISYEGDFLCDSIAESEMNLPKNVLNKSISRASFERLTMIVLCNTEVIERGKSETWKVCISLKKLENFYDQEELWHILPSSLSIEVSLVVIY